MGAGDVALMRAWDDGVESHLELVTAHDWDDDPLSLAFVRDDHLRVTNGTAEDDYIESLMRTSYREAEATTWRALLPQTWKLSLSKFPCLYIQLPMPPCIEVESITYTDVDGVEQAWDGSPLPYDVVIPSGPKAKKAEIWPAYGEEWPTTRVQPRAVEITFRAGYVTVGSPETPDIPEDITHGRLLMIGELYKQRSDSVHAFNQNPAIIRSRDLWLRYRAY